MYVYIYIERERKREVEREIFIQLYILCIKLITYIDRHSVDTLRELKLERLRLPCPPLLWFTAPRAPAHP